jgi:hypothetical protein
MQHSIEHEAQLGGIIYKILKEENVDESVDFFFDVFIRGKVSHNSHFKI